MYACSMVFCLNCMDNMVVCDFLFLVMLVLYSSMTHIEIYFIKNTFLIVPSDSSATYSLCCVLKSSNLITLASLSIIHSVLWAYIKQLDYWCFYHNQVIVDISMCVYNVIMFSFLGFIWNICCWLWISDQSFFYLKFLSPSQSTINLLMCWLSSNHALLNCLITYHVFTSVMNRERLCPCQSR